MTETSRHWFDGGRSGAIGRGVDSVLDELRALLHADVALALFQPRGADGACVLGYAGESRVPAPVRNEPLRVDRPARTVRPTAAHDVILTSTVRDYRLDLGSALLVPWRQSAGGGWLIVGLAPASWSDAGLDLRAAASYARSIRDVHREASDQGTIQLGRDVAHAVHEVTSAERDATGVDDVLDAIVVAARWLFDTEVAYLSLPESDPEYFAFTSLLGIHTSPFRRLRVRIGAGLGGLARAEENIVRSIEYASDRRLRDAPVRETVGEGIVSAMCAPLVVDGSVAACLYVGNRRLKAFSDTDAALMGEFAGEAAVSLRHGQLEEHRLAVMRQREQERLAHDIHDSVVRSLLEIGFEAEEGLLVSRDRDVRQRLAAIGRAAEYCLETLREQLAVMAGDRRAGQDVRLGELTERLRIVHRRAGVERTFELRNAEPWSEIPERVAKTLGRIGEEALMNAELHSGCAREHVVLDLGRDHVELTVADDGRGLGAGAGDDAAAPEPGHFGIRGMRAAAVEAGGQLTIEPGAEGGLLVRARIPTAPPGSPG